MILTKQKLKGFSPPNLKLLCEGCEDSHIHLLERERVEDSETELGFVKEPSALSVKSDTNALDTFREDEGSLGVIRLKVGGDRLNLNHQDYRWGEFRYVAKNIEDQSIYELIDSEQARVSLKDSSIVKEDF